MTSRCIHCEGYKSLAGCFMVIAYTGEFEYDTRGVYDTEEKARAIAKMHWRDTGQMTDVFKLERPPSWLDVMERQR